ncbi:MAG: phosphodiester glycosidase family protein [Cyanobacteria bacterium SIG29]|nr:phosphodiester glycosidase family protein [Cyanobacteria bacterium SIG29]
MYALAEQRIFCFEKMVLKLGTLLMALAVFSGQNMSMSAYSVKPILEGHIIKEHVNALFLLEKKYKNFNLEKVKEGIFYIRQNKIINKHNIKINVIEINKDLNPNLIIEPKLATENLHSKSKIKDIAKDSIIAINGTYFKQNTGTPLGTLVINNEIITGPIYERVAFGIGENEFKTGRLGFEGKLKKGKSEIKINNINQPRMLYSDVLIYTSKWGKYSPKTKANYKNILIKNNKIIETSSSPIEIKENEIVISAQEEKLIDFEIGDKVKLEYNLTPNWKEIKHIISGGPYLLKEGEIFIDTASEKLNAIAGRNPRTAIGYTKDNSLIMVTVDGRKEGTSGVTLKELAKIMSDLGCYEAINLDGGSSTVMYVNGKVLNGSNVKSTLVSNAIIVREKA